MERGGRGEKRGSTIDVMVETCSPTTHGDQPAWVGRVIFQLLAQVTHVDIHRAFAAELAGIAPHLLHQLIPVKGVLWVGEQVAEQAKFNGR